MASRVETPRLQSDVTYKIMPVTGMRAIALGKTNRKGYEERLGGTDLKPLVSILISAYNAQETIEETLQSATTQTWARKEIILVDDGSTDRTAEVARRFTSKGVTVLSTENRGLSAGLNHAYKQCQGDYIQFLDADDLLAPDKIERQLVALRGNDSKRILLSSPWAFFFYRTLHARFVRNLLWQDLSPVEWLLRKMGENLHMQNATDRGTHVYTMTRTANILPVCS
jgi:glycosyltransferase involved in cell wall biosynthesis